MQFVHVVSVEDATRFYVFADPDDARAFCDAVRRNGGAASEPTEEVLIDHESAPGVIATES